MGTAREQLIKFLEYLHIGQNAFEKKVGIANGYISHNKGSIGSDIISKIMEGYPELNAEWLITGKGKMLKSSLQLQEFTVEHNRGIVGIHGNGHQITNNDIASLIELQKGYQNLINKSQEQIDKLIKVIEYGSGKNS
jgi:hypothetical protein